MKSTSELPLSLFLLLLIAAPALEVSARRKKFFRVALSKSWSEAQKYCRAHHTDLAVAGSKREEDLLAGDSPNVRLWIGLHRDSKYPALWKWIGEVEGSSWVTVHRSRMACAYMLESKKWISVSCSMEQNFYCSRGNQVHIEPVERRNWYDARFYCENKHTDLATITLQTTIPDKGHGGWIGLYQDTSGIWRWTGNASSHYRNWEQGHPNDNCGYVNTVRKIFYRMLCSYRLPFICFEDKLVLVKESKTWEEALEHCRAKAVDSSKPHLYHNHLYDLVSLQSAHDHRIARKIIQEAATDEVWTGLRFLAGRWLWVNGEALRYQDLPLCPAPRQHCGTLSKDQRDHWGTRDCRERRNFICY